MPDSGIYQIQSDLIWCFMYKSETNDQEQLRHCISEF